MRDGVRLFTAVYVPKDQSPDVPDPADAHAVQRRSPTASTQYKADLGPSPLFGKEGYIFAYQDVRGRWMSEGEFVNMRPHRPPRTSPQDIDESTDTFDTIDWLVKNVPNHNGKVGHVGDLLSRLLHRGRHDRRPPGAQGRLAPGADHRLVRRRRLAPQRRALPAARLQLHGVASATRGPSRPRRSTERFDHGTPDGYDFFLELGPLANANTKYFKDDVPFWNELMQHGNYDDFWKARNLRPHLKNIKPAVMTVGGWFDAENLFGALETYKNVEATSPGATNVLVMGPWLHGGWARGDGASLGPVPFDAKTAEFYREQIEFPFFEYHLKGKGTPELPRGLGLRDRHQPVAEVRRLAAAEGAAAVAVSSQPAGGSAFDAARAEPRGDGFDEYVSDPAKPVPFIDQIAIGMTGDYMVQDQRFASRRPDVLVYETRRAGGGPDARRPDPGASSSSRPRAPTPTGSSS